MGSRKNKSTSSVDLPGFIDRPVRQQSELLGQYASNLAEDKYQGDWMANIDPSQIIGNRWSMDAANQLHSGKGGRELYDLGVATARGDYLDLESNPAFKDYLQYGIQDPINKLYTERLMPELQGSQVLNNSFDNLRSSFQNAQLTEDQGHMLRQATGDATMGMYDSERNRQMASGDLIDQGALQMLLPGLMKSQAGADRRGLEQMQIDKMLAERHGQFTEQERILQALMGPAQMYAGTANTTPGINRGASTAQGAIGGLAMGAKAGSTLGPWGTVIGALLGGAGGGAGGYFG